MLTPPVDTLAVLRAALGDRYIVERELGRGGMAVVYLAHDRRHGRGVAIKVLNPELSTAVGADRFAQEIRTAAQLTHPHILTVFDSGEAEGLLYYVMPFIAGESLRARLDREKQLPIDEAVTITREVADALAYAHSMGVVHRDIKPENILLTASHACVADFGIARAVMSEERLTSTGVSIGTPAYMSPEQAVAERDIDGRSDQYSLACVLYEMLAGEPPFTGANTNIIIAKRLHQPTPSIRVLRDSVPEGVDWALQRALAKVPADRFASIREFAHALHAATTPTGVPVVPGRSTPVPDWAPLAQRTTPVPEWTPVSQRPIPTSGPASGSSDGWRAHLRPPRRVWYLAGIAAALAATAVTVKTMSRPPHVVQSDLIAILPFESSTTDTSLNYLEDGVPDLLTNQLVREGGPRTVDFTTVQHAWNEVSNRVRHTDINARRVEMARTTGARQIVEGRIIGSPDNITVTAALIDVEGLNERATARATGTSANYATLVDSVAAALLSKEAGEEHHLYMLKSYPLPALRAYLDGRKMYHRGRYTDAQRFYETALDIDSTLVLAAMGLVVTSNNIRISNETSERGLRLAWSGRERLNSSDRAYLDAHIGPAYPAVAPIADQIVGWEAAVDRTSRPEAHFELGERLFLYGEYVGIPDPKGRATRSFERAIAQRPAFIAPLQRLLELAVLAGDTARVRTFATRILDVDSTADMAGYVKWQASRVLADGKNATWSPTDFTGLSAAALKQIWIAGQLAGDSSAVVDAERAIRRLGETAVTSDVQGDATGGEYVLAMNQGRVRSAPELLRSAAGNRGYLIPIVRAQLVRDAIFGRGDQAAARQAIEELTRTLEDAPADPTALDAAALYVAHCALEQWRIANGETGTARQAMARMRALIPLIHADRIGGTSTPIVGSRPSCLAVLDAMLAAAEGTPDNGAIARADSLMARGPMESDAMAGNLAVAQLLARAGNPEAALRALRRRPNATLGLFYLAPSLREEGRLAEQAGDRAGAIRAYRHYLALRTRPDPEIRAEVDSVSMALARVQLIAARNAGESRPRANGPR